MVSYPNGKFLWFSLSLLLAPPSGVVEEGKMKKKCVHDHYLRLLSSHDRSLQTTCLNNRNLTFPSSAGCEVQDQGTGWFCSWCEFFSWPADGCFLDVPSCGVTCSFYKGNRPIGLGPHSYELIEPLSPPHGLCLQVQ